MLIIQCRVGQPASHIYIIKKWILKNKCWSPFKKKKKVLKFRFSKNYNTVPVQQKLDCRSVPKCVSTITSYTTPNSLEPPSAQFFSIYKQKILSSHYYKFTVMIFFFLSNKLAGDLNDFRSSVCQGFKDLEWPSRTFLNKSKRI